MPTHVKQIGGKWRVVDPDDSITKNKGGTPVDGKGHSQKEDAVKQVQAINLSMKRDSSISERVINMITLRLIKN